MCILDTYSVYFTKSELQMGFKKKIGYAHALYTVRSVVDYFTSGDSVVNLCALDISKEFDKVNHYVLFMKLMEGKIPVSLLYVLVHWHSLSTAVVKWQSVCSYVFQLHSVVRQGDVLYAVLFGVYVNSFIDALIRSGLGCHVAGVHVGCIVKSK